MLSMNKESEAQRLIMDIARKSKNIIPTGGEILEHVPVLTGDRTMETADIHTTRPVRPWSSIAKNWTKKSSLRGAGDSSRGNICGSAGKA